MNLSDFDPDDMEFVKYSFIPETQTLGYESDSYEVIGENSCEESLALQLCFSGDKRVYTLDDEKLTGDSPSQIGPDRRYCRECRITLSYPKEFREHRKQWHALQCARCDFRATKESTIREHFEKV